VYLICTHDSTTSATSLFRTPCCYLVTQVLTLGILDSLTSSWSNEEVVDYEVIKPPQIVGSKRILNDIVILDKKVANGALEQAN